MMKQLEAVNMFFIAEMGKVSAKVYEIIELIPMLSFTQMIQSTLN
jgi:hypothetical protein